MFYVYAKHDIKKLSFSVGYRVKCRTVLWYEGLRFKLRAI